MRGLQYIRDFTSSFTIFLLGDGDCKTRLCAGTIEDKILQLQEQKRGVVDAALGQGSERHAENNKLTAEDLTFLFN